VSHSPNSFAWVGGEHAATRQESNPTSRAKSTSRVLIAVPVIFLAQPILPTCSGLPPPLRRDSSPKCPREYQPRRRKAIHVVAVFLKTLFADFAAVVMADRFASTRVQTASPRPRSARQLLPGFSEDRHLRVAAQFRRR